MPNNREWAVIAWVAVAAVYMMTNRDLRQGAFSVLRSIFRPKILLGLLVMAGWTAGEVVAGQAAHLWRLDAVTDTAFWFVFAALTMFVNVMSASESPHYFRNNMRSLATAAAFLGGFIDLFPFPLPVEICLFPIQLLLLGVYVLVPSSTKIEVTTKRFIKGLLLVGGLSVLLNVLVRLASGWDSLDKLAVLRAFILPVWLTLGLLPVIYGIAICAAYGGVFAQLNWSTSLFESSPNRGWRLALVKGFGLRIHELHRFIQSSPLVLGDGLSAAQIKASIQAFRRQPPQRNDEGLKDTPDDNSIGRGLASGAIGPVGDALRSSLLSAMRKRAGEA